MSAVRGSGNDLESRRGHPRDQRLIDSGRVREGAAPRCPCLLPEGLVG